MLLEVLHDGCAETHENEAGRHVDQPVREPRLVQERREEADGHIRGEQQGVLVMRATRRDYSVVLASTDSMPIQKRGCENWG